ncbi:hypothetical protein BDR04DRAFT_1100220 [Suillus decipiens]|nr:hypothetical protein BDR04DRAFT_1100220 [Suillus decipiens]
MQLSVLFSALVSLVILATALPTPGATLKRSYKRESKKRDELETNLVGYIGYGGGSGASRAIKERDELESNLVGYIGYDDGPGGPDGVIEERDELETNLVGYIGYGGGRAIEKREELDAGQNDYAVAAKREELDAGQNDYAVAA